MHDPGKLETVLRYHEQTKHHLNRYGAHVAGQQRAMDLP